MKKILLSKKGFTLVECLVAIVIFAIMSLMISMMYSMSITTYKGARDIDKDISVQEHDIILENRYGMPYNSSEKEDSALAFNFFDEGGGKVYENLTYDFEARKSSSYDEYKSSVLLSYAIASGVKYADSAVQEDEDGVGGGGSPIPANITPTIYGSANIDNVIFYKFENKGKNEDGKYEFEVSVKPIDTNALPDEAKYRQIKLNFSKSPFLSYTLISDGTLAIVTYLPGNILRISGGQNNTRNELSAAVARFKFTSTEEVASIEDLQKYFGSAASTNEQYDNTPCISYSSTYYVTENEEGEQISISMPGVYGFIDEAPEDEAPEDENPDE